MSDEELMRAYQAGSEDAFMKLYRKFAASVFGFCRKRLRSEEAEDFYQKIWRHLHEKRAVYKGQPFAPWFFVLIRHLLVDEYRSLNRQVVLTLDEEDRVDLEEVLSPLSEENRDLVVKYYLEEVSYKDLSLETGLSASTLRQKISRAVRSLNKR